MITCCILGCISACFSTYKINREINNIQNARNRMLEQQNAVNHVAIPMPQNLGPEEQ